MNAPNHLEAWSTGAVRFEIAHRSGYLPVTVAVELIRISHLVHVIAHADADDPAFRDSFPIVMTCVEVYPTLSVLPDALSDLGIRVANAFRDQLIEQVAKKTEQSKALKS
jgi:hypothetical protein